MSQNPFAETPPVAAEASASPSPPASPPSLLPLAAAALLPVLAVLAVFGPICAFHFVNLDDCRNVFQNPHIVPTTQPITSSLAYFWTHPYYDLYMPLTYTVWTLLAHIAPLPGGELVPGNGMAFVNAGVFHTASLFLHALNALLVWVFLRRLGTRPWPASLGATLWAIHPLQSESVAWITGMNNLTGTFFVLITLLLYLSTGDPALPLSRRRAAAVLAFLTYLLALLAKPTSAAVPVLVAVLEMGILRRPLRQWGPKLLLWTIPAVLLSLLTRFTSATDTGRVVSPVWGRPIIAGDALAFYAGKILWPDKMGIDYGRTIPAVLGHWWGYVLALVPVAVAALLYAAGRRGRSVGYLAVAGGLFVAALTPMLGFVPFYSQITGTVGDRYVYLALIGPAFALAGFLTWDVPQTRAPRRHAVCAALAALWCMGLGVRCYFQNEAWRESYTLAYNGTKVNPHNAIAHRNIGIFLAKSGKTFDALAEFRLAAALKPDDATNQYHLGTALADTGDTAGAIAPLARAVAIDPDFDEAWFRLGVARAQQNDVAGAETALRQRLRFQPSDGQTHYILGVLLGNAGRTGEATTELEAAVRFVPAFSDAHFALGKLRQRAGRTAEAVSEYREALRLNPDNAPARAALRAVMGAGGQRVGK